MSVEDVAQVKNEMIVKYGPNSCDGACGAFNITSNVAWRLKDSGWGLIKSTGNGCDTPSGRFRADTIMLKDGTVIDLLMRAENNEGKVYPEVPVESYNIPSWNSTGAQPSSNWFAPYDPGNLGAGTNPPPDGGNGEEPPGDNDLKLELIIKQNNEILDKLNELRNTQMNQDPLIIATKDQVCAKGFYNNLIRDVRPK